MKLLTIAVLSILPCSALAQTIGAPSMSVPEQHPAGTYAQPAPPPPPVTYQTYGNTTYGSDGSQATTSGNSTYISGPQGSHVCTNTGAETICQ